ncbi:tripartite tricarboxylate transporter TctB family protein [Saccharopolyspora griseoalba]|uniref:Tripartite tricarboxylate transporter TctB family protein n=1 Tax=Saccharopolyspora griseoalba TaxID=1431848 RepID=A0ABW2LCZ7_9PSEU
MSPARAQVVCFAVLTVLGLAFAATAPGYGVLAEQGRIGPGFLPLVGGLALAGFSAALLVAQLRDRPPADDDGAADDGAGVDDFGRSRAQRARILRRVLVLLPAAVLAVPLLGMVVSFAALVLVISVWLEGRRLAESLLLSAAAGAAIHAVFAVALQVPLPTGLLGS